VVSTGCIPVMTMPVSRFTPECDATLRSPDRHFPIIRNYYAMQRGFDVDLERWRHRSWFHQVNTVIEQLTAVIAEGTRFVLIDNDEWGVDLLPDREARPFMSRDGAYWGAPEDDAAAISQLERERELGRDLRGGRLTGLLVARSLCRVRSASPDLSLRLHERSGRGQ